MKIAIAGGTGFVGRHLARLLKGEGHEVLLISRTGGTSPGEFLRLTWDELRAEPDKGGKVDAVVNLSGESINQRWTRAAKERILKSRLDTTRRIAGWVDRLAAKPAVVVNGSGMSIYGSSETQTFDESSGARLTDYLAEVVEKWEQEAERIRGTRLVKLRVGLVLGTDGGALPKMAMPYKLGVGGRVGSGRQWISWIHVEDMSRLILFCIENDAVEGPVNAVGPGPVTNNEFGRALGKVLRRPHWFPVPSAIMKLVFGELSVLLLEGQRVLPRKALDAGYTFRFTTLDGALEDLYWKNGGRA